MRISSSVPRFSGVYVVHAAGLSRTPEIERLTRDIANQTLLTNPTKETLVELASDPAAYSLLKRVEWVTDEIKNARLRKLRDELYETKGKVMALRRTQQTDIAMMTGSQMGKNPFVIRIPEKKALYLQHFWRTVCQDKAPGVTGFQHWLEHKLKRIESRAAILNARNDISSNDIAESPFDIQAKEDAEEAHKQYERWQATRGSRMLLFVDDEKGKDGTRVKSVFKQQLEALNEGDTVSLPYVLPLRGLLKANNELHPRTNRANLNYSWYTSTLMSAKLQHQDDLVSPKLDGVVRLSLEAMTPTQKTEKIEYQVKARVNEKTMHIKGGMDITTTP